jgi:oligopeptide transport system permease protein
MAAIDQNTTNPLSTSTVATLRKPVKGTSLWSESWKRLRRNKAAVLGGVIILLNILMAVFAPVLAPRPYDRQVLADNNSAPLWVINLFPNMQPVGEEGGYVKVNDSYALGADNLGRDLLSRIIYGSRVSLTVAFVGPVVSIAVGLLVGMLAGYFGGMVDNLLMRIVDVMYAFPTLLFIILLMTFFRTGFATPEPGTFAASLGALDKASGGMLFIFIGIGLTSWMQMARLVRGQVLSVRRREYIEAAESIGAKTPKIMLSHVLPNILGPLIVAETLTIPTYISYEAFLSFIGLGVNPPTPSWGAMISEGSRTISSYPYQALFPAIALFLIMFAFNFLGDGLRDALDPRMRGVD